MEPIKEIRLIRDVVVNRKRDKKLLFDPINNKKWYIRDQDVAAIPRYAFLSTKVQLVLFSLELLASNDDVALEYKRRGLKPDPRASIEANIQDPGLATSHPNVTIWKDRKGQWHAVAFDNFGEDTGGTVYAVPAIEPWSGEYLFAGVPIHNKYIPINHNGLLQ